MKSTIKSNKKHLLSLKQVNMAKNKSQSQYPDTEFKGYLNQLSNPNYQGGSWVLPDNPTPLEKSKHELCREILIYQRKNKLTDEEIAEQMELTLPETEDILHYRINYFTLDRLITYANKLFKTEPLKIGIVRA
jgi:predicted XRE-type DNA-binding protein